MAMVAQINGSGPSVINNPWLPAQPPRSEYWWEDAACRTADPELFFPTREIPREQRRAAERKAKSICAGCPVIAECLQTALERDERHGIWGGLLPRERKQRFARSA